VSERGRRGERWVAGSARARRGGGGAKRERKKRKTNAPDRVVRAEPDPLRQRPVLLLLLGQDALDAERLVGRLLCWAEGEGRGRRERGRRLRRDDKEGRQARSQPVGAASRVQPARVPRHRSSAFVHGTKEREGGVRWRARRTCAPHARAPSGDRRRTGPVTRLAGRDGAGRTGLAPPPNGGTRRVRRMMRQPGRVRPVPRAAAGGEWKQDKSSRRRRAPPLVRTASRRPAPPPSPLTPAQKSKRRVRGLPARARARA
jgi:hypothetical protein